MTRHLAPAFTGFLIGCAAWLLDSVLFAFTTIETSMLGAMFTEVSLLRLSVRILLILLTTLFGGIIGYRNYCEEQKTLGLGDYEADAIFTDQSRVQQQKMMEPFRHGDGAVRGDSYVEKVSKNEKVALANQPVPYDEATKQTVAKRQKARDPKYKNTLVGSLFAKPMGTKPIGEEDCQQVWQYAGRLGEALNLTLDELEAIRTLCYCHNLGKFAVCGDQIHDHAELSARIIEEFPSLANAADLVRYHHERWDGSGLYGLAGLEIPLGSRIFAVAWVYHALTKPDGPYRMKTEEALESLYLYSETALDPELVAAFIGMMGRGKLFVDHTVKTTAFSHK